MSLTLSTNVALSKPTSMLGLIDWCLRRLGGDNRFGRPVGGILDIDITDQQLIDRVCEAVTRFNNEHFNGYQEVSILLNSQVNVSDYVLPNEIISVNHYLKIDDKSSMFSFDYQMRQSLGFNFGKMGGFDLVSVELTYEWLKMVDMMIGTKYNYTFNPLTHVIHMMGDTKVPYRIALICYALIDVDKYPDIWNDIWLREYTFQLIKRQWGENLKLFGNVTLPGGATLNGEQIYSEANERVEILERELETKYSEPCMFFMG